MWVSFTGTRFGNRRIDLGDKMGIRREKNPFGECREMRRASLTRPELCGHGKRSIGGRNCHRKHVEDG
ncbi:hypothetical protein QQP08_027317 [Theobroma cacao]|nr:hypothetical protein QQP08_027317 [Theobroma cacao]